MECESGGWVPAIHDEICFKRFVFTHKSQNISLELKVDVSVLVENCFAY